MCHLFSCATARTSPHPANDCPALLINGDALPRDLHTCAGKRLNAFIKFLDLKECIHLPDHAEQDISTVTTVAWILVRDVSELFRTIERREYAIS